MTIPPAGRIWVSCRALGVASLLLAFVRDVGAQGIRGLTPPPEGWTREEIRTGGSRCSNSNCRFSLKGPNGGIEVNTRAKEYKRTDVPGWGQKRSTRAGDAVAQAFIRGALGGTSEYTKVGHGTRLVSESVSGGWRLSCRVFWLATESMKAASGDRPDYVAGVTLNAQGMDCAATTLADTATVRWRFTRGIAPAFDSLAAAIDSLSNEGSPLLTPSPPMTLERLAHDSVATARYDIVFESLQRVRIRREMRDQMAAIYLAGNTTVDLAPGLTEAETHVARLIAAALAIRLR